MPRPPATLLKIAAITIAFSASEIIALHTPTAAIADHTDKSGISPGVRTIYNFKDNQVDGAHPMSGLVADSAERLYGTAYSGGGDDSNTGAVYELARDAKGNWTERVLFSFNYEFSSSLDPRRHPPDQQGANPASDLLRDNQGNLYGTTVYGGECGFNCGTVFEISPMPGGEWTGQSIYIFGGYPAGDGQYPHAGLLRGPSGALYGTTTLGGGKDCPSHMFSEGCGVVFQLTSKATMESVIYEFHGPDGSKPYSQLDLDGAGNLYGTTKMGGASNQGTVFELSPEEGGAWNETVLHSFQGGRDGAWPVAGVVFDSAGNLYGTTSSGGYPGCLAHGCGTVFKLSRQKDGTWKESVLHYFRNDGHDGSHPQGSLVFLGGALYGTTSTGGDTIGSCYDYLGCGTVFRLAPDPDGHWSESVVHAFQDSGGDGESPMSNLISAAGRLYGTTFDGGAQQAGTVFEVSP